MKKKLLLYPILLAMTAVLFGGCLVTSIHPLGNEDDIVFDENLIGMWDVDDDENWLFTKGENNTYKLIISSDEGSEGIVSGEFIAKLVRLSDKYFLDIFPERLDTGSILTDVLMLPTHTFLVYSLEDSELYLGFTDPEWFTSRIDLNEDIGIDYVITEDEVITLTAPTEELQAFYLKHADDHEFFELDDEKLHKNPDSAEIIDYLAFEKYWTQYKEHEKALNQKKKTLEQKKKEYNELSKSLEAQKTMLQTDMLKKNIELYKRQIKFVDQEIQTLEQEIKVFERQSKELKYPSQPEPPAQPEKPPKPKLIRVKPEKSEKRLFPPEIMDLEDDEK
ncbi:hypothetical protein ACFL50_00375 [Candidatus Latescibacterota bacterium]